VSALDRLGVSIKNTAEEGSQSWRDGEEEIADIEQAVERYAKIFHIAEGNCVCGRTLGGLIGTFVYGIQNGEGWCSQCDWPARAIHRVKDEKGEPIISLNMVLAYAPIYIQAVSA